MFKFLDATGATYYNNVPFYYNLPAAGHKWSEWTIHPAPADLDGNVCGPGRLHLMLRLDAGYAPANWWPWWARGAHAIGVDQEKASFGAVQLRLISPRVFARCLRPPFNWGRGANLTRANLSGADLSRADLRRADLRRADLRGADLRGADLRGADLRWTDLSDTNLSGADLRGADLRWADLRWTDLSDTNLSGADLSEANLRGADLSEANLRGATWNEYTRWPEGFKVPA